MIARGRDYRCDICSHEYHGKNGSYRLQAHFRETRHSAMVPRALAKVKGGTSR